MPGWRKRLKPVRVVAKVTSSALSMNLDGRLWMHRFAVLTAVCTFPLIFTGGLVTSTGSALAVPDWPTTYGQNMFLFPPAQWIGGILYEHGHRLIGAAVGLLTLALAGWIWLREPLHVVRWLAVIAVFGVCLQGLIGGLRVILVNHFPAVAAILPVVHACLAQAFFALMVTIAFITSPRRLLMFEPTHHRSPIASNDLANQRLCILAVVTTALIYLQIVFGALTRHNILGPAAHIVMAFLVAVVVVRLLVGTMRRYGDETMLVHPALLLLGLMLVQLFLGFAVLIARASRESDLPPTLTQVILPTAHVALGALILATGVVLTLRIYKFDFARPMQSAPSVLSTTSRAEPTI